MEDVKSLMKKNYLKYASYVILDRAIPNVYDGLKPVQRRILHTLYLMDDGKLHKLANVSGQTMVFHPHGNAPIEEAAINIANKGYLLDKQGNFGNIFTGDPAAAARYIETRLSALAKETMFNPDLTKTIPSYDGRRHEPICLPAKIPLLLLQGTDGIAVGMSTHILPHNFVELIDAEIKLLEGEEISVLPDFPTGGLMDASDYQKGKGKIKLRAKIETRDPKTIVIKEICYGTTTESLIRSIDEAAKKGKIKIESINDYTAEEVEIEIKLPRGSYAEDLIDALYAYTDCQISISCQMIVIKDDLPCEMDVHQILQLYVDKLQGYLKEELEIEKGRLTEKIFQKTLEQIFIENRLYKKIENINTYEKVHSTIETSLEPFHKMLNRVPTYDDREILLSIPIRRISRFDIEKNEMEIVEKQKELATIEKHLKNIKKFAVAYLKGLLQKYGKEFPRKTVVQELHQLDMRAIETRNVKVGFDAASGFIGTKVAGEHVLECTNFDKLLLMYDDGTYVVTNIPEKQYVAKEKCKVIYVGVADKKTPFTVVFKDPKTHLMSAKKFIITTFKVDKPYRFLDEGKALVLFTTKQDARVELQFIPKTGQKTSKMQVELAKIPVKGVTANGSRLCNKGIKKACLMK